MFFVCLNFFCVEKKSQNLRAFLSFYKLLDEMSPRQSVPRPSVPPRPNVPVDEVSLDQVSLDQMSLDQMFPRRNVP